MTDAASDWIYCRLVDRGSFIMARHAFWFGHMEFCSDPETDRHCVDALTQSMRRYAVSESGDGWNRLVRARLVVFGETADEAMRSGAIYVREAVQLFNTYVIAPFARVRETDAGYLHDLRTRAVRPLAPIPEARGVRGISAVFDDRALHPKHTLNMLLVTAPQVYGELGGAFRRCAHWRELAHEANRNGALTVPMRRANQTLTGVNESSFVKSAKPGMSGKSVLCE